MEEESWRRNHGGGIMGRKDGGEIAEEKSRRRNHGEEILGKSGAIWRHLEASGRQLPHRRHPGDAPRRLPEEPEGIQEAPRMPEATLR